MGIGLIIAVVFAAQSASGHGAPVATSDAAFEEMSSRQTDKAIAELEAALERNPDDPSLLINLGTAYFRANRLDEARAAFREAAVSEERYRVELADGSWEDSRKVARLALDSLDRSALAAK